MPQSSTVTIFDARSNDSAVAPFPSVHARWVMVVAATPIPVTMAFMVIGFSPASARRRLALAIALATVKRAYFAISTPYLKHSAHVKRTWAPYF